MALAAALLGCRDDPSSVVASTGAFADAAAAETAAEALAACERAAHLREDCVIDAVRKHRIADAALCAGLGGALWRDECFFQMAEALAEGGDEAGARVVCAQAGEFASFCAGHVVAARFRRHGRACAHPVDCLVAAEPLVAAAMVDLGSEGFGEEALWALYVTQAAHGGAETRAADCARAPDARFRRVCEAGLRDHVERIAVEWSNAPSTAEADRAAWCAFPDPLPDLDRIAGDWFDLGDEDLARALAEGLRLGCLPSSVRERLAIGWIPVRYSPPEAARAIVAGDLAGCAALPDGPIEQACRDRLFAARYRRAAEPCDHPAACMGATRPIVEEAAALGSAVPHPLEREWGSYFFQSAWRVMPLSTSECAAAPSRADRATCAAALADAARRTATFIVAGPRADSETRRRACSGGERALLDRVRIVDAGDPAMLDAVREGLRLGCPEGANPRDWPWEAGQKAGRR